MDAKDRESEVHQGSRKERRDDFTWLVLFIESITNRRRKTPFKNTHHSYYGRPNTTSSQGFRFSDEREAEEQERKRRKLALELNLVYLVLMIVITLALALLIH